MSDYIYFDNAATTPCDPRVVETMIAALTDGCGNPSSHYTLGYEAKNHIDTARAQVAAALNVPVFENAYGQKDYQIYFTGSGSEADNWALKGAAYALAAKGKNHIITSAFEHHAILHSAKALEKLGFAVTYLPVTPDGFVTPESVAAAIRPETALVSVMMANNEIGTIQPIREIAAVCKAKGVLMHTDAVQAVGSIPVDVQDLGVDMLSLSGHKFNGPKGVGVLYCRRGVRLHNLIDGGGQESSRRAGTENVAGIAGLGKAIELATQPDTLAQKMQHQAQLRDYVMQRILKNIIEVGVNGSCENRLPGNLNISFAGLEGESILLDLDMQGICASTGSACNADDLRASHVIAALGKPDEVGHSSMRFSFGGQNTMQEAQRLCDVLEEVIPRRRSMSCLWNQAENTVRIF